MPVQHPCGRKGYCSSSPAVRVGCGGFSFSLSLFFGGGGRYTFSVERLSDPHVLNYFAIPFPIVFSAMPPLPASEVSWKSGGSVAEKLVFLKKIALSLQLFGRRASSRLQC